MKKLFLILAILLVASPCFATDYYVSSTGSGGNGSKESPWAPSEIPWANFLADETDTYLYFFGGTYTSSLTIAHASSTNRLYIKPCSASPSPSGCSGEVIFDTSASTSIKLNGMYITIDGETTSGSGTRNMTLELNSNPWYGIEWGGMGANYINNTIRYVTFQNLTDTHSSDPGWVGKKAIVCVGTDGTEIAYNHFSNNAGTCEIWVWAATSGYGKVLIHDNTASKITTNFMSGGNGVDFYNNTIDATGSQQVYDIIHSYVNSSNLEYIRVYNNTFISDDQMNFFENKSGTGYVTRHVRVYNNTYTRPSDGVKGVPILFHFGIGGNMTADDIIIANNTFVKTLHGITWVAYANTTVTITNSKILNNIYYDLGIANGMDDASIGANLTWANEGDFTFDYNLMYSSNAWKWNPKASRKTYTSLSTWNTDHPTLNHNPALADPLFVSSSDFHLQGSSPAIDKGVSLGGVFITNTDKDGVTRPVGSSWDIGAYEYGEDSTPPVISNPLPSGAQACDEESPVNKDLAATSNENATGKYGKLGEDDLHSPAQAVSSSTTYDYLPHTFATTGGTSHSQTISVACDESHTYYSRYMDASPAHNKSTVSTTHNFSITPPPTGDATAPVLSGALPATGSFLSCTSNPRDVLLQVTASDATPPITVKYHTSDVAYDDMSGTMNDGDYYETVSLACGAQYTYCYRAADSVDPANKSASSLCTTFTILGPIVAGHIQGEDGVLVADIAAVADENAEGGFYIATTTSNSGTATFTVPVATTGTYRIIARVYAPDSGTDSFYLKIDALDADTWDLNPSSDSDFYNVWFLDYVAKRGIGTPGAPQYDPYQVELTAGDHTFVFSGRERNARLDYFYLESVDLPPQPPMPPTDIFIVGAGSPFILGSGQTFILQ